ncbi:hypothetical protein OPQ81_011569 [Rhizoctonia solani]|nr:hypothetical protein OPQ81_011569 [Rhizoctonia solani]
MSKPIDPSQGDPDGTVTTPAAGTSRTLEAIKKEDRPGGGLQTYSVYAIFISSRSILTSCHWAVGTFVLVSSFSWYTCRSSLAKEQRVMRTIAERYPERNAKRLRRKDSPNMPPETTANNL